MNGGERARLSNTGLFQAPSFPPMGNNSRTSFAGNLASRQSLGPPRVTRSSLGGMATISSTTNELAGMSLVSVAPAEQKSSRLSLNPRQSIDPRESLNRRSSAFGKALTGNAPFAGKDPRPIREKNFQMEVIRSLINFLAKSGYPHPISQKILTAPSAKDFQNIFKFLYSQLDPGYDFGKKFEEEVPVLMKGLRYPFAGDISKSQLYAVGSMHAWPGLLAMLGWMVDLINCCDELSAQVVGDPMSDGADNAAAPEKVFFDYLCKSYKVFLAGSDNFDPMIAELGASFDRRSEHTFREAEELSRSVAELEAEYQSLVNEESPLVKAQREVGLYSGDIEKFQKFIAHLEVKKQKFEEAIVRLAEDIAQCEQELSEAELQRASLQAQVDSQDICPEDIDRMNADKEQLVKTLESLNSVKEEANKIFWEREMFVQKKLDAVEKLVQEYNFAAEKIAVIPREASNAKGRDLELIFNPNATRNDQLLNHDIRSFIHPALNALRDESHMVIHQTQDHLLSLQETLDKLSEQCTDRQAELRSTEDRIRRLVQTYLEQKEACNLENRKSDEEAEQLEQTIQKMRSDTASQSLQSQQRLQRSTIEYDQLVSSVATEKERIGTEIYRVLEDLINLKTFVESSLADLTSAFEKEMTI